MPRYLFSYHGGEFPPELGESTGALWSAWLDDLGAQIIDRGGPLNPACTLRADGTVIDTGPSEASGYSIISAASMDEALAIARGCPQTRPPHKDGSVEVAELIEM